MEQAIKLAIEQQAKKLLEREKRKGFATIKHQRRFRLRTNIDPAPSAQRQPGLWSLAPHFNPRYCLAHSKFLAKTIWRKISDRSYEVEPAVLFSIPKESGGHRDIMVFTIPDTAVANLFNRKLRERNRNLQSPFCYSYRKDRTIFDAVLQTSAILKGEKTYVIQYDFAKYFDSIKHDYINFVLDTNGFSISPTEKYLIQKFLKHRYAQVAEYRHRIFNSREIGVPQGCSLSLFLSNLAAHELDKELERSNGMFVRFADDIVCTTRQYDDALRVTSLFRDHCYYTGISINYEKSEGICLISGDSPKIERDYFIDNEDIGKIQVIDHIEYIGHKFSKEDVEISKKATRRIKKRISKIIYIHLLHNLKRDMFNSNRIGAHFYDWDLVTCINELRNYMYGGLKQQQLVAFQGENTRISRFKGLMSFYPLVTRVNEFAELDGWLVSALRRAIKERARLIHEKFGLTLTTLSNGAIVDGSWYEYQSGISLETNAPSFVLAWRAARKAFKQYGLADFEIPKYYSTVFDLEYSP